MYKKTKHKQLYFYYLYSVPIEIKKNFLDIRAWSYLKHGSDLAYISLFSFVIFHPFCSGLVYFIIFANKKLTFIEIKIAL